jgi:cytochrome c oxidase cbb3-type subunit 3
VGSCATCHQTIFNDQKHAVFTGQPKGDAQAGARLFAQVCATCHGADGTTAVGDKKVVINAKEYWSTHDDAAILRGIGIGSHGKMTAFAQGYGGPLSWDEVLNLTAFVRSWGPLAAPVAPTSTATGDATNGAKVYAQYCAGCHGDKGQGGAVAQKPLNAREYLASVTDDTLRQVILKGITGMPGFANIVGDKEVTDLIAFFRSWQR